MVKRRRNDEEGGSPRKKPTQSRIGRACDRCQHRKLACDLTEHSCQQCQKANTWCTSTDFLTGIPAYRGQFEYLERRVERQHREIQALVNQLKSMGQDVPSLESDENATIRYTAFKNARNLDPDRPWEKEDKQANYTRDLIMQSTYQNDQSGSPESIYFDNTSASTPEPVSSHTSGRLQHPLYTTSLSSPEPYASSFDPLGWSSQLNHFVEEDPVDPNYAVSCGPIYDSSYASFVASTQGQQVAMPAPDLPSREKMFNFSQQYMGTHGCYAPVLHEPSFLHLLARIYDHETFQPSIAETVCLHMILAISFHRAATKNSTEVPTDFSMVANTHYHYSLSFWNQLMAGTTLDDMQALALLCFHSQSFSKPEPGWTIANAAFEKLLQLQYHRAIVVAENSGQNITTIQQELRKRVFWTVTNIYVTSGSRLGWPISVTPEDIEIDFPIPINDEHIGDMEAMTETKGMCRFSVALESYRIVPLMLDLLQHKSKGRRYRNELSKLINYNQIRLTQIIKIMAPHIRQEGISSTTQIQHLQIKLLHSQYKLLLYQPVLFAELSSQSNRAYLKNAMEAAKDILDITKRLSVLGALELTWNECRMYLFCMQSVLLGHQQLCQSSNATSFESSSGVVRPWLDLIVAIGRSIGISNEFENKVNELVNNFLSDLQSTFRERRATSLSAMTPVHTLLSVTGDEEPSKTRPGRSLSAYSAPPQWLASQPAAISSQLAYMEHYPVTAHHSFDNYSQRTSPIPPTYQDWYASENVPHGQQPNSTFYRSPRAMTTSDQYEQQAQNVHTIVWPQYSLDVTNELGNTLMGPSASVEAISRSATPGRQMSITLGP